MCIAKGDTRTATIEPAITALRGILGEGYVAKKTKCRLMSQLYPFKTLKTTILPQIGISHKSICNNFELIK